MCLIIHRPMGCTIAPSYIENALEHNSDGWGIMAAIDGKIVVKRGLDAKKFNRNLNSFGENELFIHFRYATHGKVNTDNCHPFSIVNGDYSVMHNGTIAIDTKPDASKSDTWHWCNRVLAPILEKTPDVTLAPITELIETLVGASNKIVVLRSNGDYTIANYTQGYSLDGLWLSNQYSIWPVHHTVSKSNWKWEWTDKYSSTTLSSSHDTKEETVGQMSLEDLASLSIEDLVETCEMFPEEIAEAIHDHFNWTKRR